MSKERYNIWVSKQSNLPFFYYSDWLNIACGENNWEVVVSSKGDEIRGILIYYKVKRFLFSMIKMPPLTPYMSPIIIYPIGMKTTSKHSYELKTIKDLLSQIPKVHFFRQKWGIRKTNMLPFFWAGYNATTFYTYYFEDVKHKERLLAQFTALKRKNIRFAARQYEVALSEDVRQFLPLLKRTFLRQKMLMPFSESHFLRMDTYLKNKGKRQLWVAKTQDSGSISAGVYLVVDHETAYMLLTGKIDDAKRGVISLLYWEVLKSLPETVTKFDFTGSKMENVEPFLRGFGGALKPYFLIHRSPRWFKLLTRHAN